MVGDKHSDVFSLQFKDNTLDIFDSDRVDTRKRLIQQNKAGINRQSPCNFGSTPLTT